MAAGENALRAEIIAQARTMNALGINQGTSGNLSVRAGGAMLITPSGTPYDAMNPAMIAKMKLDGGGAWSGPLAPSSEWRFHHDIYRARPDAGAIVHAHPPYATALSMLRRAIPAAHYMIAAFGGANVRCTDYAPFGTQELSDLAIAGLQDRSGVLLGSHGMIVIGGDLEQAMGRAVELEALARQFYLASLAGAPVILTDEEIARTLERFKNYGPARKKTARRTR